MKYLKTLSLVAVAAAFLMALSGGTASADEITSSPGVRAKETVDSVVAGTSAKLLNTSGGEILTCTKAKLVRHISSQGPGMPIVSSPDEYILESCTLLIKVLKAGSVEIAAPTGSTTATVTATSESQLTINTVLFGSCVYGVTAGTTVGSINTSSGEFTSNAVTEKLSGSAAACPETSKWIANWIGTVPSPFLFDNN